MNPVEFRASGRTVKLDCISCGSIPTPPERAMAGAPCPVCGEPLRYRLVTGTNSLNIERTEVVRVLEREKRIDRIAMLMGSSATFALEPSAEDLAAMEESLHVHATDGDEYRARFLALMETEESLHVRTTKARVTSSDPPAAPPSIVPPAAVHAIERPIPVPLAPTPESRTPPSARARRTPRGLGVLVVTAVSSGVLWLYSLPSDDPTPEPNISSDFTQPQVSNPGVPVPAVANGPTAVAPDKESGSEDPAVIDSLCDRLDDLARTRSPGFFLNGPNNQWEEVSGADSRHSGLACVWRFAEGVLVRSSSNCGYGHLPGDRKYWVETEYCYRLDGSIARWRFSENAFGYDVRSGERALRVRSKYFSPEGRLLPKPAEPVRGVNTGRRLGKVFEYPPPNERDKILREVFPTVQSLPFGGLVR